MGSKVLIASVTAVLMVGGFFAGAILGSDVVEQAVAATEPVATDSTPTAMGRGQGRGGFGVLGYPGEDADGVLAGVLGLTQDEFHAALAEGNTIAEIATSQGKDVDAVIGVMVGRATARVEAAVEAGEISQDQADLMLTGLTERMTEKVQNTFNVREAGGFGPGTPNGLQDCTHTPGEGGFGSHGAGGNRRGLGIDS